MQKSMLVGDSVLQGILFCILQMTFLHPTDDFSAFLRCFYAFSSFSTFLVGLAGQTLRLEFGPPTSCAETIIMSCRAETSAPMSARGLGTSVVAACANTLQVFEWNRCC